MFETLRLNQFCLPCKDPNSITGFYIFKISQSHLVNLDLIILKVSSDESKLAFTFSGAQPNFEVNLKCLTVHCTSTHVIFVAMVNIAERMRIEDDHDAYDQLITMIKILVLIIIMNMLMIYILIGSGN